MEICLLVLTLNESGIIHFLKNCLSHSIHKVCQSTSSLKYEVFQISIQINIQISITHGSSVKVFKANKCIKISECQYGGPLKKSKSQMPLSDDYNARNKQSSISGNASLLVWLKYSSSGSVRGSASKQHSSLS